MPVRKFKTVARLARCTLAACVVALAAAPRADAARVPYFEMDFTISLQDINLHEVDVPRDWTPTETLTKDLWGLSPGGPSGTGTLTFYTPETHGSAELTVRGGSGAVIGVEWFESGWFEAGDPTRGRASDVHHALRYSVTGSEGTLFYLTDAIEYVEGVAQFHGQSQVAYGVFFPWFSYALTNVRMSEVPAKALATAPIAVTPRPCCSRPASRS